METAGQSTGNSDGAEPAPAGTNEVRLRGRVAAAPEERELPSGDRIVALRVIVARGSAARRRPKASAGRVMRTQTVDTIDLVCWTAAARRSALRLAAGATVEVTGALRRRFFGGPGGRQSRYEVEVGTVRRVSGDPGGDT